MTGDRQASLTSAARAVGKSRSLRLLDQTIGNASYSSHPKISNPKICHLDLTSFIRVLDGNNNEL